MTAAVLSALLSHWRRKPLQLLTLVLGLSLATALWSGVQAINAEARKSYSDAADVLGGGGLSEIVSIDNAPINLETYVALRRAGWQVSPVIDGWLPARDGRVRLLGFDPFTMPRDTIAAGAIAPASFPEMTGATGLILAHPTTAHRLRALGEQVRAVETLAPGLALADITRAQALLEANGFSRLLIANDQPLSRPNLADIAPNLRVNTPQTAQDLGRLTDSFHLNLTAFGLLSFAVGLFIVNGSVGLAFEQRRPVFRTLRALGVPARRLVVFLTLELLILAIVAGVLGIFLGYVIAALLIPDVAATLRGLYGASVEGTLTLAPSWWLSGVAIACLGTALAATDGLVGVARMPPLAPARPRAWAMVNLRAMRWHIGLALVCLFASGLALAIGGGLTSGFVLLGGFLLAAALFLPSVLSFLVSVASRFARRPVTEWFWADTRQQLPGLSLALMALLLALSANIGVGTMVDSFRKTFTGWLDQRLVSDLYVSVDSEEQSALFAQFLDERQINHVPIFHTDGEILGGPAEIYGVIDHEIYRNNWPLLSAKPDTWDRMAAGQGVLINEQLARREGLEVADTLPLPGGWSTEINGIYSDYGNPLGQVILPLDVLLDRYASNIDTSDYGLILNPGMDIDTLKSELTNQTGIPPENMIDQAALKAFSLSIFNRTFAVTGALNVLTLAVAGAAILTSLLTLASMRLPQLAPVWAIGLTRNQLARIELLRSIVLAGTTFVLSIPVGLGLAWVLLAVINVEAFGWRLPMYVFPADWIWLGSLSLIAALLASLWPAWTLAKRPTADLIRVFTHER